MSSLSDFLAEPRNVIVAGVKRDGRPHLSPNWFFWDGERFFISTTRDRVKFKIFSRDPRVELIIDDATGHATPGCRGRWRSSRTSPATSR